MIDPDIINVGDLVKIVKNNGGRQFDRYIGQVRKVVTNINGYQLYGIRSGFSPQENVLHKSLAWWDIDELEKCPRGEK